MNIVITGGLGYIGSVLCELYRDRPEHKVTVIDNRIVADRIANFPTHFDFIHADVSDVDDIAAIARNADVMHYLAAQVEAESSTERSEAVWRDNFEVPKRIFENLSSSTRILFPSSGNVFGGIPEGSNWQDLIETDTPAPKLPYAETKREMELFLTGSDRNFVITRFGTNYGYAPGARFNLVTNIFTKRALEGKDLRLHGGGLNWRPTASVTDCARALLFLSELEEAQGEIYHVSNASFRICDLAETIVRVLDTGAEVINIDKKVPFNSYALNSDKIKNAGFEFEWPLERAILDMKEKYRAMIKQDTRQP